jgi:DNA replication protein DnaC
MSGAKITPGRLDLMLTELRLPTIKRLATDLCAQFDREGWPGHRLLEALVEHEITERETRRIDRHRIDSCLPPDKRLSSFEFAAVPSVSKAQVMALAEGQEMARSRRQRPAVRPAGRGQEPSAVRPRPCPDRRWPSRAVHALQRSRAAPAGGTARPAVASGTDQARSLRSADLLILDDLSYVRRDQAETSVLFELIAERYERKSLAITANTPFSQWN